LLIAVDLDGTLLGRGGQVSARTAQSLLTAKSAGHSLVAVTGRSWRTCVDRLKPATAIDYVVCSNGAYAYDIKDERILWSHPIDPVVCLEAMRKIRIEFPNVGFGWESATGFSYEKAFLKQSDDPSTLEHGGSGGVLGQSDLYKVLIRVPCLSGAEFQQNVTELVGDVLEASTSGAPFLDATALHVNKASGLEAATLHFDVQSSEVVAFGDNLNDIPMLTWAGTAIAMSNAHPEVLQIADAITVSNMRDGVAVYLDKFVNCD
jgi:Cof subfamily protein (haloacid dehalogenase superfamily)